jgi:hypothetical protein
VRSLTRTCSRRAQVVWSRRAQPRVNGGARRPWLRGDADRRRRKGCAPASVDRLCALTTGRSLKGQSTGGHAKQAQAHRARNAGEARRFVVTLSLCPRSFLQRVQGCGAVSAPAFRAPSDSFGGRDGRTPRALRAAGRNLACLQASPAGRVAPNERRAMRRRVGTHRQSNREELSPPGRSPALASTLPSGEGGGGLRNQSVPSGALPSFCRWGTTFPTPSLPFATRGVRP